MTRRTGCGRVLLVDDDTLLQRGYRRLLEQAGFEVAIAADGAEGERLWAREPFDVVLTDIQMPGRSGFDLVATLRARGGQTPVVLMTASSDHHVRARAAELELPLLHKPVRPDALINALRAAIGGVSVTSRVPASTSTRT